MRNPLDYPKMRYITKMSRIHDDADYILGRYERTYGWMDTWPASVLDRCYRTIRRAVA